MAYVLDRRTREALARAIHEDYRARASEEEGPGERSERAVHVSYDDLPEEARESNRRQADDIGVKLEMIKADVVPLAGLQSGPTADFDACDEGDQPGFAFSRRELERLSRHEHARWAREKRRAGWRYGPVLDEAARIHPCLVGYDRLPEAEKEKDRQVVERIPWLLRAIGLEIVRRR